jgi:FtsP/CotA-like multicopper oxidase with cupredoxin domain
MVMPDGVELRHWGFADEHGNKGLPSPLIRVREGQVVHVKLVTSRGPHTIHLHGIEPDDHNDGVGHTSFDVDGEYTYQFKASQAGTYFYHCHVNTVLHFALGLFGGLIVDPAEGPGHAWTGGPAYDAEAFWVGHTMDPKFQAFGHAAGLDGEDLGLNLYDPKYFLINGVPSEHTRESEKVTVNAQVGDTVLVRLLNANYHPQRWTFQGLDAEFIASDGRPFPRSYTDRTITMAPAERYDALLRPKAPGVYTATVETLHWITGKVLGVAEATITVTGEAPPEPESPAEPDTTTGEPTGEEDRPVRDRDADDGAPKTVKPVKQRKPPKTRAGKAKGGKGPKGRNGRKARIEKPKARPQGRKVRLKRPKRRPRSR